MRIVRDTSTCLVHLLRALDRRRPVTISYTDEKGDDTVRTVEITGIRTTNAGHFVIDALCRLRGESRRFHLEAIRSYTVHRMSYVLDHETDENTEPEDEPTTVAQLIENELKRDREIAEDPEYAAEIAQILTAGTAA